MWASRFPRIRVNPALAVLSWVDFVKKAVIRLMAARLAGQQTRDRNIRPAMA